MDIIGKQYTKQSNLAQKYHMVFLMQILALRFMCLIWSVYRGQEVRKDSQWGGAPKEVRDSTTHMIQKKGEKYWGLKG